MTPGRTYCTIRVVLPIVLPLPVVMSTASVLAQPQPGTVLSHEKISDSEGGSFGFLHDGDVLGSSVALLGDVDGDGVGDLAVGARLDDDGGTDRGAVWIQFLDMDGRVKSQQKISDTEGGFTGVLDDADVFGSSVAALGDLDGGGPSDFALAVGAHLDDDGGADRGAVWILFLSVDTKGPDPVVTVDSHHKISDTSKDLPAAALDNGDRFGWSAAALCDLNGDDIPELAVGARLDDDGGTDRGAVWILFLNTDGTVASQAKISSTTGGLTGPLDNGDNFGNAVTSLGMLDNDAVCDLAVGARADDDGGENRGAMWILFLNVDGTVKAEQKISDLAGGFGGELDDGDLFGSSLASFSDLDGDSVPDLAVGAPHDDDGGTDRGAVWILFLNEDGTVASQAKISDMVGGFSSMLDDNDAFGNSLASLTDHNGDGTCDLAVGAFLDDDGGNDRGAAWTLFLDVDTADPENPVVTVGSHNKISDSAGGSFGFLHDLDHLGFSVASLGDLDGDGITDLAVGALDDNDGGTDTGAVWILFLNADGTVKSMQKISSTAGGFTGMLAVADQFGSSVTSLGDLDGAGPSDHALAVGARLDDDGGANRGAVWILFLNVNTDGAEPVVTVDSHHKISDTSGDLPVPALGDGDRFGGSLASLGDHDGDGNVDLAVGAPRDDDGDGTDRGAVWILLLNEDGTVKSHQKISDTEGNFTGTLLNFDRFGVSLGSLDDLDGDGVGDLAAGALDNDGGFDRGAVWILFLNTDGTVKSHQKISDTAGGFSGVLDNSDLFGISVSALCDLDGDSVGDLAVGAYNDDDGGTNRGAVWILFLNNNGTVKSEQKISSTAGGFTGELDDHDLFGGSADTPGDLDGDGVCDLVVGAHLDDDGGIDRGAAWVLFLDGICPADLNSNGDINSADLALLLGAWGPNPGHPADINGDGVVNAADLALLLGGWGPCP